MDEQIMSWATSRPEVSKIEFYLCFNMVSFWKYSFSKDSFMLCNRIGTWEANVMCICGEQEDTDS